MLNVLKRFNLTRLFRMESNLTQLSPSAVIAETNLAKRPDENEEVAVKKQKLDDQEQLKQTQPDTQTSNTDEQKIKKRKYALLIGYSGEGYYGLQRNASQKTREFPTIEDEIVDALVKVNAIPQGHADEMFKMSFQRAARTDKGVSAAANLLSLKMELADDTLQRVNDILPKQIKIFGYNKVTQGFDCKQNCDARTYIYILPTYAFCPIEEILSLDYRITDEVLDKVNETLRLLQGTHNFHNFTSGRKYTDPSAKRYIMQFEISKPFIKEGHEFAVIKVKGQSFMLHQIRKMIGMVIAVVRGYASLDSLELCWTANKVDVPTAPALGLMLERLHYDKYNRKYGKDGIHKPIEWPELEEEIDAFKHEYIFSNIVRKELTKNSMFVWLTKMCICHFGILDPKYMRGAYTGVGRANYLVEQLNGVNYRNKSGKMDDDDSSDQNGDD